MANGYKAFIAGAILAAADVKDYLMLQSNMKFATTAARDAALASVLREGLKTYQDDTNQYTGYDGAAWQRFGGLGAWTPNVPGSANLTIGSGTLVGSYQLYGKHCIFSFRFIMGAGSAVGSAPTITLPVAPANDLGQETGTLTLFDATGAGTGRANGKTYASGSNIGLADAVGAALTATSPFTWAAGDKIFGTIEYETS